MADSDIDEKLKDVLAWANSILAEGNEPPWSWYQFMKLREAIEAINQGSLDIPIEKGSQQNDHQKVADIVQLHILTP